MVAVSARCRLIVYPQCPDLPACMTHTWKLLYQTVNKVLCSNFTARVEDSFMYKRVYVASGRPSFSQLFLRLTSENGNVLLGDGRIIILYVCEVESGSWL